MPKFLEEDEVPKPSVTTQPASAIHPKGQQPISLTNSDVSHDRFRKKDKSKLTLAIIIEWRAALIPRIKENF
jgi:hypothetical protein